jgi:hypothetical protein
MVRTPRDAPAPPTIHPSSTREIPKHVLYIAGLNGIGQAADRLQA